MFEDRGMNTLRGPMMLGSQPAWKPEHAPKVEPLTKVLNDALGALREAESRLKNVQEKIYTVPAQPPTAAELSGGMEAPYLSAGEVSAMIKQITERIKKLACELDERL